MDIKVGDKITYKLDEVIRTEIATDIKNIENINEAMKRGENYKILKIERPNWEVVEEKKELLTDEEREFLKLCLKFFEIEINSIELKEIQAQRKEIHFNKNRNGSGLGYWYYTKNEEFKGLELDKVYTLSELRIGGINNGFRFRRT